MRFVTSFTTSRGGKGGGSIRPGDGVHTRGWNAGVTVTARERGWNAGVTARERGEAGKRDEFDVYMTRGSHGTGRPVHIGTVAGTPDGPAWEPADKPGRVPARISHDGRPMDVIAAIPARSHLNATSPPEHICVVWCSSYASGEPRFAVVRATRSPDGTGWVTEDDTYDHEEYSQTAAVGTMVRLAGHERPGATSLGRPVPGAPTLEEARSISRSALTVIRNLLTEEQLDASIPALDGKTARQLLAESE
jgi:hypothetical protein